MRSILFAAVLATTTLTAGSSFMGSAEAQKISNSPRAIAEFLGARGYSDVKVVKQGFTITTAEACKGPDKFKIKISVLGQVKSAVKIGSCATVFGPQQIANQLQDKGYSQIDARVEGNRVVALACRNNSKYRLTYARDGKLLSRYRFGRCQANDALSPKQVADALSSQGYNRITFIDDQLPRYVAEACIGNDRVRLELNRRANIRTERRIGRCAGSIAPSQLSAVLEDRGFKRISITQGRTAPYRAEACRNNDRLEVVINRYGEIVRETRLGECRRRIEANQLPDFLADQGYDRVKILRSRIPYIVEACQNNTLVELTIGRFGKIREEQRVGRCAAPVTEAVLLDGLKTDGYIILDSKRNQNGRFAVEACKGTTRYDLIFSRYGEEVRKRVNGECQSQSVLDVLSTLESRGAEQVNIFVEGCFRNRKYRWEFDRLGNRTGRTRLPGNC